MSKKTVQQKKTCLKCESEKRLTEFYMSNSTNHADKKYPVCKSCIKENLKMDEPLTQEAIESIKNVLLEMNRPFIYSLYISTVEEAKNQNKEVFGLYIKNVLFNFKNFTWKDSEFETDNNTKKVYMEKNNEDYSIIQDIDISEEDLDSLKEKYGHGYPDEEYILFEKKFRNLKPSFQLPTTMHEEYLREYCVNKVKETIAKAKGDFKEAKEWATMAKESAEAGKLKPSQMSKADLSKGLDGFGQLSRMVEQHNDIIPLLPKFIKQPKDDVDVTLWLYINYVRDLEGLPEASYEEIYSFYEERRLDYESQKLDASPEMQVDEEDE